jgi:hypothetical protein
MISRGSRAAVDVRLMLHVAYAIRSVFARCMLHVAWSILRCMLHVGSSTFYTAWCTLQGARRLACGTRGAP